MKHVFKTGKGVNQHTGLDPLNEASRSWLMQNDSWKNIGITLDLFMEISCK